MNWILFALDNSSVAAFLGAASAFALVILYDSWRERRKVKSIRSAVAGSAETARAKLETVRRLRDMMTKQNMVQMPYVLPFSVAAIRSQAVDVAYRLSSQQSRALEGVCYRMEGCDQILWEARSFAEVLEDTKD